MSDFDDFFDNSVRYGAIGMEILKAPLIKSSRNSEPVNGYHVFSTKPFFAKEKNKGKEFSLPDFGLKTAELSALCWRRYNGPIYLITDAEGEAYFKKNGLEYAYDGILPILETVNHGINPVRYWASGKIEALKMLKTPCAIIDLDLIVWKPLELQNSKLTVAHVEHLVDFVYPPFSYFNMSRRYLFPSEWDRNVEPFNTAFNYIADEELKEYYVKEAIRFMQFERDTVDDGVKCMVFAEQRILGMCAEAKGIKAETLLDFDNIHVHQDCLTHIWSAKSLLFEEKEIRNEYINLCIAKTDELKKQLRNISNT